MLSRKSVGGLLLEDVEGWTFDVGANTGDADVVITGAYYAAPGELRITTVPADALRQPVTHEACLAHAAKLAETSSPSSSSSPPPVSNLKPSEWQTSQSITGPYGSANFVHGTDRVFCWYCCRAPGVIVAAYTVPAARSHTATIRGVRAQCNVMITTALFDRRAWGDNDDELTKILTALLGADDEGDA